jgi:hypothetical protein
MGTIIAKHRISANDSHQVILHPGDNERERLIGIGRNEFALEDAALIARAVNSHVSLVHSLKTARDQLRSCGGGAPWLMDQIDAALKLAEPV